MPAGASSRKSLRGGKKARYRPPRMDVPDSSHLKSESPQGSREQNGHKKIGRKGKAGKVWTTGCGKQDSLRHGIGGSQDTRPRESRQAGSMTGSGPGWTAR